MVGGEPLEVLPHFCINLLSQNDLTSIPPNSLKKTKVPFPVPGTKGNKDTMADCSVELEKAQPQEPSSPQSYLGLGSPHLGGCL